MVNNTNKSDKKLYLFYLIVTTIFTLLGCVFVYTWIENSFIGTIIGKILAPLINIINLLSSPLNAVLSTSVGLIIKLNHPFLSRASSTL